MKHVIFDNQSLFIVICSNVLKGAKVFLLTGSIPSTAFQQMNQELKLMKFASKSPWNPVR